MVEEGVICTKVSPNSKFIAVAMLDSCVKIYFCDSHKFFLSLYGHKLPVLCMDISSDNRLIVTGSSDKNIKIWGMDFGDCHRSLFAHDDNILCVQFVPKTHHFFTTSKDQRIKMWDADSFEKITTLEGHHGEIWAMSIAPNGKYMVTASHDKSIRLWEKTNEPLILEEEKELENEKEFNKEFDMAVESHTTVPGGSSTLLNRNEESGRAQKKTTETIRSIERLIESIDIYCEEIEKLNHYNQQMKIYENRMAKTMKTTDDNDDGDEIKMPIRESCNPNLMIYRTECPYRFMLEILIRIPSHELEETLLQLPFYYIQKLLQILSELLERRWEIELVSRCVCYLIRVNFGQITSCSSSMVTLIDRIRNQMQQAIESVEELAGINHVGLKYFENIFESRQNVSLFAEVLSENRLKMNKNEKNKKHKKRNQTAPILTWN
ncbi:WD repeat-containing POC1 centriolar protein-like protein [Euroglyphus maynei]|uniref:WD repeat-containing POC1 centriolar protein-like protein n=1 Tax=Euroglyphus maynei TaxID=6958 RepID=A0A1Y3BMT8_EURMA|nr:WD repeat-containing POC1 centriolar protein-like protein [Euroglyphus maynei]